jgi:hypothetical protein
MRWSRRHPNLNEGSRWSSETADELSERGTCPPEEVAFPKGDISTPDHPWMGKWKEFKKENQIADLFEVIDVHFLWWIVISL